MRLHRCAARWPLEFAGVLAPAFLLASKSGSERARMQTVGWLHLACQGSVFNRNIDERVYCIDRELVTTTLKRRSPPPGSRSSGGVFKMLHKFVCTTITGRSAKTNGRDAACRVSACARSAVCEIGKASCIGNRQRAGVSASQTRHAASLRMIFSEG